jgi:ribosomal protein L40E
MEQRNYQGAIDPGALADYLVSEWDRDDTVAQALGDGERVLVQIGQRSGGFFSDEPRQALTLDIQAAPGGVQVVMGQQQWYKESSMQIFAGGLIGFLPFFFTFPLGRMFGDDEIDASLPGQVWQSIDRFAAANAGAATGQTQRLAAVSCPSCGVANPAVAERCSACGSSLTAAMCARCGHANPPGATFCNQCGTQLGQERQRGLG